MDEKMYALVGSFSFGEKERGITVLAYNPETAGMQYAGSFLSEINVGQQSFDAARNILYVVDECKTLRGKNDGAGQVAALDLAPGTGALRLRSLKSSLSALPSYVCVDKSGRYALVSHFCSDLYVTKIVEQPDGSYGTQVQFDDAALVLFRLEENGDIGEVCDVALHHGEGGPGLHTASHLHSVVSDPGGELFLVCDMGTDKIYSYGLDRKNGKLIWKGETLVASGCSPRYGVFHPTLPFFFSNNQTKAVAHAFWYDGHSGALKELCVAPLFQEDVPEGVKTMPSDIKLRPGGRQLYVSVRGMDRIAVLDVGEDGTLRAKQSIGCGGEGPRGICISPDGRFLFAVNRNSNNITAFSVKEDGLLEELGSETGVNAPGNMQIITVKQ